MLKYSATRGNQLLLKKMIHNGLSDYTIGGAVLYDALEVILEPLSTSWYASDYVEN